MSLFYIALTLAVSLLGILCGVILTFIAPEELAPGKKYFQWGKRICWAILGGLSVYLLFSSPALALIITLLYVVVLVVDIKFNWRIFILVEYVLLSATYLLTLNTTFAAAIFVYGLFAGTMLRISYAESKSLVGGKL